MKEKNSFKQTGIRELIVKIDIDLKRIIFPACHLGASLIFGHTSLLSFLQNKGAMTPIPHSP